MPKIYIAGKVSGLHYIEVTAQFAQVQKTLEAQGYEVVNPLTLIQEGQDWIPAMRTCIAALVTCDEIFMLGNWRKSPGARLEFEIAAQLQMPIHYGL